MEDPWPLGLEGESQVLSTERMESCPVPSSVIYTPILIMNGATVKDLKAFLETIPDDLPVMVSERVLVDIPPIA